MLIFSLLLAAAPSFKLAAPEPSINGIDEKTGRVYYEYLTQQLSSHEGLSVVRESDIASLLGMERQGRLAEGIAVLDGLLAMVPGDPDATRAKTAFTKALVQ